MAVLDGVRGMFFGDRSQVRIIGEFSLPGDEELASAALIIFHTAMQGITAIPP